MSATATQHLTGWELSRAVAGQILGCKVVAVDGVASCGCGVTDWLGLEYPHGVSTEDDGWHLKPYHSDIGAAWEVMRKAQEWTDDRQVRFTGILLGCVEKSEFTITADILVRVLEPENICRAALAALGEEAIADGVRRSEKQARPV